MEYKIDYWVGIVMYSNEKGAGVAPVHCLGSKVNRIVNLVLEM